MTKDKPGIDDNEGILFKIQADIEAFEEDAALYLELNFDQRMDAIDFLEFHIIEHIESLLEKATRSTPLLLLKQRAEKLRLKMQDINNSLFENLKAGIRAGDYRGGKFEKLLVNYVGLNTGAPDYEDSGYDNLDIFINGLLSFQPIPGQTKDLEPDMVFYQKTPARVIFELIGSGYITNDDVFFDLGSGLGQASILVNLLAGIKTRGVEFEPAFCNYANNCAKALYLPDVIFINADARQADYCEGTVFFMYTPFKGEILQDVLALLKKESQTRKIKIITYGPCTAQVASHNWLHAIAGERDDIYRLAVFYSI